MAGPMRKRYDGSERSSHDGSERHSCRQRQRRWLSSLRVQRGSTGAVGVRFCNWLCVGISSNTWRVMEALVGGELDSDGGARAGAGEQRRSFGWWHWRSRGGWRCRRGEAAWREGFRGGSGLSGGMVDEVREARGRVAGLGLVGGSCQGSEQGRTELGESEMWLGGGGHGAEGAVQVVVGAAGGDVERWSKTTKEGAWTVWRRLGLEVKTAVVGVVTAGVGHWSGWSAGVRTGGVGDGGCGFADEGWSEANSERGR